MARPLTPTDLRPLVDRYGYPRVLHGQDYHSLQVYLWGMWLADGLRLLHVAEEQRGIIVTDYVRQARRYQEVEPHTWAAQYLERAKEDVIDLRPEEEGQWRTTR